MSMAIFLLGVGGVSECDLFWLGVGDCGREFMSLSQKYEERVQKFSFLARHHFKAELYCYIYIVTFVKISQNYIGLY